jgi:hypothetical protein
MCASSRVGQNTGIWRRWIISRHQKNNAWLESGAVSVNADDELEITLSYHSELPGKITRQIIGDIRKYWASKVHLSLINTSKAKANFFLVDGTKDILSMLCGPQSADAWIPAQTDKIGGSVLMVNMSPPVGSSYSTGTFAHEFGHNLGARHAPKGSGSIMSYDTRQRVQPELVSRLVNAYRGK